MRAWKNGMGSSSLTGPVTIVARARVVAGEAARSSSGHRRGCGGDRSRRSIAAPPSVAAPEQQSTNEFPSSLLPDVANAAMVTAIKTPYQECGRFDLDAFDALVEGQIENGVQGLVIGGTTGEGHLMSWDEHIMLIAHTCVTFPGRVRVIGNTGSNSTNEAVHASEQGFNVGMHAALHINPYYGKTSAEGMLKHFEAAFEYGPAIVYNVPSRTGQDIPDAVVEELSGSPAFIGVKECTGNARIATRAAKNIRCWSGNDDEAHAAKHEYGGFGVVSVTSNLVPSLMARLVCGESDYELADRLKGLMNWLFCEPNPIPLNTAMAMCGLAKPVFRRPYAPLSKERRIEGAKILEGFIEHIPGCKEVRVMEDNEFICLDRF